WFHSDMKLLRTFPKDAFEFGLASWQWLGLREQTPRFATCFGDIFLESLDGWWFLDTVEGTLELRWTTAVHMYAELESPEGRATYLMDDLVREARSRGIHFGEEDVYTFNPHPALGGQLGVDSIVPMRFELAVSWLGAVHDQVLHHAGQDLPPLPDDGRRNAPQVAAAWDSAWSHDETFDVPFEQYLATTTFAAVATPRHGGAPVPAHPAPATPAERPWAAHAGEPAAAWDAPAGRPSSDPAGPAAAGAGRPGASGPSWTDAAPPAPAAGGSAGGSAAGPAAAPAGLPTDTRDEAGWSGARWSGTGPGTEPTSGGTWPGTAGTPAGADWSGADWSGTGQDWSPADGSAPGDAVDYPVDDFGRGVIDRTPHAEDDRPGSGWGEQGWSAPAWPGWGGQEPAVAAGGAQQAPPADPFTAWDDLWGRR